MLRGFARPALAVCAFVAACVPALGQSFNLDLDIGGGDPGIGAGAPSDAFGAAANQPGHWNRVYGSDRDALLSGLDGSVIGCRLTVEHFGGPAIGVGFAFQGNTGDSSLLLNDAAIAGPTGQGGHLNYGFAGFAAGAYDVYTYAVHIGGLVVPVPVSVPEAASEQTQVVTGPMPGNAFGLTVTHSLHRVNLAEGGGFHVDIVQPGGLPPGSGYCINGFQIVAVPEQATIVPLVAAVLLIARKGFARGDHFVPQLMVGESASALALAKREVPAEMP